MGFSNRYKILKREIARLRRDLLPRRFNPSGRYSREAITKTIAYRVLVHAEIEDYLEDRAWGIAQKAVRMWKRKNTTSKTLLALIAFSGRLMEKPPKTMHPEQPSQVGQWDERVKISKKIDLAMNDFYRVIEGNHGIKEENIVNLLLSIGAECEDLDPVLVADLNSFGESRGLVAHKAYQTYSTTQQIDPKEEMKKVKLLIENLISIDIIFKKLLETL